jgi:type II secretory pathway component HofQ
MNTIHRLVVLLSALAVSTVLPSHAQNEKPKERLRDLARLNSIKVDLELKDASIRDSLQSLFAKANVNYIHVLEVASRGKITMELKNVPFEGALVSILRSVENIPLSYRGEAGVVIVQSDSAGDPANKRVWMDVERSDVRYLLKSFIKTNYVLDQAVQGAVTLKLGGVPYQTALDGILKTNNPPLYSILEDGVLQFKVAQGSQRD